MTIIDFHAHCYPDNIWPKVEAAICQRYNVKSAGAGTLDCLHSAMSAAEIDMCVVQPVANQPKHVRGVNDWAESLKDKNENLFFFGAIHPGMDDPYEEVCRLAFKGFRGVKMQPNAGGYYPDSKECMDIYQALRENDMVLLSHVGDELKPVNPVYAHPKYFKNVLESFPDLKIVLAHLGGYNTWDSLDQILGYKNAYYDTAMSCEIGAEKLINLVERIGMDNVVFGSDYPWYSQKKAVEHMRLVFGKGSEAMFCENPRRVLGIL